MLTFGCIVKTSKYEREKGVSTKKSRHTGSKTDSTLHAL